MNFKIFSFYFFWLICFHSYGQKQKPVINDFSVILHEEAVNKVIAAIVS